MRVSSVPQAPKTLGSAYANRFQVGPNVFMSAIV